MDIAPLPPGRLITSDEGHGDARPLWLSDAPATAGLWSAPRAEHAASGLWPLLLDAQDPADPGFRPWASGEFSPERMSSPADHDADAQLARWWGDYSDAEDPDTTAPFGQTWPGRAPAEAVTEAVTDAEADAIAEERAQALRPGARTSGSAWSKPRAGRTR